MPTIKTILTFNAGYQREQKPKVFMEMSGIEPEAFRMRNRRSTTELHPHIKFK